MIILWGTRVRKKVLACEERHCMQCHATTNQKHVVLQKFFTFFFVPVFCCGEIGEVRLCCTCGSEYELEVDEYC